MQLVTNLIDTANQFMIEQLLQLPLFHPCLIVESLHSADNLVHLVLYLLLLGGSLKGGLRFTRVEVIDDLLIALLRFADRVARVLTRLIDETLAAEAHVALEAEKVL